MKHESECSNWTHETQFDEYSFRLKRLSNKFQKYNPVQSFNNYNNHKNKYTNTNNILNTKNSIFHFFLFLIISFNLINQTTQKNFTDEDCIAENTKNFDFYKPISKLINNPSQCTEKSSACCYIEVNYDYAGHLIDNNFCVLLSGDVNARIQQITGILTDQIRYYSHFIYNNYNTLTSIGNNLAYIYHENYTCYERAKEIDYYYYSVDNCAFSNSDGTCKLVNDYTYKDNYVQLLYNNITKNFCNNKDELGNCVYYQQSPNYNETGLSPLLEYLKASLDLYDNSTDKYIEPADDPIEEQKNDTELSQKFYKNCKPIVPAKVKIVCPSSYVDAYFYGLGKGNFFLLILLLALIF